MAAGASSVAMVFMKTVSIAAADPASARPMVIGSANSRSPPCGTPLAMRVTASGVSPNSRPSSRLSRSAVASPSTLGGVATMISRTSSSRMRSNEVPQRKLLRADRPRAGRGACRGRSSGRASSRPARWPRDRAPARRRTGGAHRACCPGRWLHTASSRSPPGCCSTSAMLPQRTQGRSVSGSRASSSPSSRATSVPLVSRYRR